MILLIQVDKFDQNNVGLGASLLSGFSSDLTFQFTGSGITTDSYARLLSVPSRNAISIARTTGDNEITTDQFALLVSPSVQSTAVTSNSLTTFTSTNPHGLVVGNKFQFNDSSNNNQGTFIVKSRTSSTVFTATTDLSNGTLTNGFVLKHGYSANDATSDIDAENLSVRGIPISGNEFAKLAASVSAPTTSSANDTIRITLLNDKSGILNRFSYGSYLQIDDEIIGFEIRKAEILQAIETKPGTAELKVLKDQVVQLDEQITLAKENKIKLGTEYASTGSTKATDNEFNSHLERNDLSRKVQAESNALDKINTDPTGARGYDGEVTPGLSNNANRTYNSISQGNVAENMIDATSNKLGMTKGDNTSLISDNMYTKGFRLGSKSRDAVEGFARQTEEMGD